MSKYHFKNSNIYYEGTSIPKNLLHIKDADIIHEIEKELLTQAYEIFLKELNSDTVFDEIYFIKLHKITFSTLYEFSGVYRDVNMSKNDSLFCRAEYLYNESKRIFEELKKVNYLKSYQDETSKEFARKLAYFQGELIALHPFYELNGRILRLFFDMIVRCNGYEFIDYGESVENGQYIEASIQCVQYADSVLLESIIFKGLHKCV